MRHILALASALSLGVAIVALACGESLVTNTSNSADGSSSEGGGSSGGLDGSLSPDAPAGTCIAEAREFASAEAVSAIAANNDTVYWANSIPDGSIIGCATTGCGTGAPFAVTNQFRPIGLTVGEKAEVYWTTSLTGVADSGTVQVRVPGGPASVIVARPYTPKAIVRAGDAIYWLEPDFPPEGALMRCILGDALKCTEATRMTTQNFNGGLATHSGAVYWTERQRVNSLLVDGGTQGLTPSGLDLQPTLAVNDKQVFYADKTPEAGLRYVANDGLGNVVRLFDTVETIRAITLSSDRQRVIYMTTRAIMVVQQASSGNAPKLLTNLVADDPSMPAALAVSGECVYWFNSGKIMTMKLPD